jgi:hypothetical protein
MNESANLDPAKPSGSADCQQLKETCAALESQLHTLRIVVLVALVITGLFFWREGNLNGYAAAQMQPQVSQITQYLGQLEKQGSSIEKQMQALQAVAMRLSEFGKSHPDYQPILQKYGIPVGNAPAAAPAAAKPANLPPATVPPKK